MSGLSATVRRKDIIMKLPGAGLFVGMLVDQVPEQYETGAAYDADVRVQVGDKDIAYHTEIYVMVSNCGTFGVKTGRFFWVFLGGAFEQRELDGAVVTITRIGQRLQQPQAMARVTEAMMNIAKRERPDLFQQELDR